MKTREQVAKWLELFRKPLLWTECLSTKEREELIELLALIAPGDPVGWRARGTDECVWTYYDEETGPPPDHLTIEALYLSAPQSREREAVADKVSKILLGALQGTEKRYRHEQDGAAYTRWGLVEKDIRDAILKGGRDDGTDFLPRRTGLPFKTHPRGGEGHE